MRSMRFMAMVSMLVVFGVLASASGAGAQQAPDDASSGGPPDHARAEGYRDLRSEQPRHDEYDELAEGARRDGTVRAIVGLRVEFTPEGSLDGPRAGAQRAEIARQRRSVQAELRDTGARTTAELQTVPYLGVELPEQGVEALRRSPHVASVDLDEAVAPALAESTPLVQGSAMHTAGYTGAGKVVAILDTGVDKAHPFFGGRVVQEACYSSNTTWSTSLCPGQATESTAPGSGAHCTGVNGCGHGTHVAGIAAGSGGSSVGVAPAAGIMAVQVFSRFDSADDCGTTAPCLMSWSSDQMKGLERVYALRATHDIAAANLSLGGAKRTAPCDTDPLKSIIDTLNAVGTATVLAAGNNSWSDAVTAPSCISTAVTVGSTTKTDAVSPFTNSHPTMVDLYAPGSAITSAVPGGGFASWNGTSMAAPQVAGAWAVLLQARPTATVTELLADLRSTGRLVTDARPADPALHHAHPRILVDDARNATAAAPAPAPAGLTFVPLAPCAVFDTRSGQDGFGDQLAGGEKRTFQVTGAVPTGQGGQTCPAPPAEAVAVELNLVAAEADAPGNLQIAAAGSAPRGGVVNFVAGVSNSNALPVEVSSSGAVDVVNNTGGGNVDVRGVVLGYYTDVEAAGLEFVPVAPCAVFDTRSGEDGFGGQLAGGEKRTFQVTGAVPTGQGGQTCPAPPAEAVAVKLNLVALEAAGSGNLQIAGAGVVPQGGVVNFTTGVANSNALPVEVSTSGAVDVVNNTGGGDVDVRGVVLGYYTDLDPAGLEFVPLAPCAVFDTRSGAGGFAGALAGGVSRTFQLTGAVPAGQGGQACQAPPADAVAVELNLVAVEAEGPGNLQIAAAGVVPRGGVVNFITGVANSNALPVKVSTSGAVDVTNNTGGGDVHVRGVALGYYLPSAP